MLTVSSRPMTPAERAQVEQTVREIRRASSGCVYFFIQLAGGATLGMLASVIPLALLNWLGARDAVIWAAFLLCTLGGFLLGVRCVRKDRREGTQAHLWDLAENAVQEIHCTVLDVVRVASFADEGPGFFLDVGDAKLLYLQGWRYEDDDLAEPEEEEEAADAEPDFPCRELRLVRTPHGGLILSEERGGEPITPSRFREPLDPQTEYVPEVGEILSGALATLEADLRRLRQSRNSHP